MKELPIPSAAVGDSNSIELARIWAAEGDQHISLATGLWNDPAMWGMMLVDLAKHVALSYAQAQGRDGNTVLKRIREGFDAEWEQPTDSPAPEKPK